jgi:hypothetical protein
MIAMIDVIRIFSNDAQIEKPEYTSDSRKTLGDWLFDPLYSKCFVEDSKLYIHKEFNNIITLDKTMGCIVIKEKIKDPSPTFITYPKTFGAWNLELVEIKKSHDSSLELHLIGTEQRGFIAPPSPKRTSHKIANLEVNKAIRYQTNYKFDTTGTLKGQRLYSEHDWIIEYLGSVSNIDFSQEVNKKLSLKFSKVVNERKILK